MRCGCVASKGQASLSDAGKIALSFFLKRAEGEGGTESKTLLAAVDIAGSSRSSAVTVSTAAPGSGLGPPCTSWKSVAKASQTLLLRPRLTV